MPFPSRCVWDTLTYTAALGCLATPVAAGDAWAEGCLENPATWSGKHRNFCCLNHGLGCETLLKSATHPASQTAPVHAPGTPPPLPASSSAPAPESTSSSPAWPVTTSLEAPVIPPPVKSPPLPPLTPPGSARLPSVADSGALGALPNDWLHSFSCEKAEGTYQDHIYYENWTRHQLEYCCTQKHIGCEAQEQHAPPLTFKCVPPDSVSLGVVDSLQAWGWSQEQGAWCCEHWGVGCFAMTVATTTRPAVFLGPDLFDCNAGLAGWRHDWLAEKAQWCCARWTNTSFPSGHHGAMGQCCVRFQGPACSLPALTDCERGLANWEHTWSIDKKIVCCKRLSEIDAWPPGNMRALCCGFQDKWADPSTISDSKGCIDSGANNSKAGGQVANGEAVTFSLVGLDYGKLALSSHERSVYAACKAAIQNVLSQDVYKSRGLSGSAADAMLSGGAPGVIFVRAEVPALFGDFLDKLSLARDLENAVRNVPNITTVVVPTMTLHDISIPSYTFHTEAMYECHTTLSYKHWSSAQLDWCCERYDLGCMHKHVKMVNRGSYDCNAGFSQAEQSWSLDKKTWCCITVGRHCPHDCSVDYDEWRLVWSKSKKEWCCNYKELGCRQEQDDDAFDCDSGFVDGQGLWVPAAKDSNQYLLTEFSGTFKEQAALCTSYKAHMAMIKSQETNSFLTELIGRGEQEDEAHSQFWIGVRPGALSSWLDGSALTYTSWNSGEPNTTQAHGGESCAQIRASPAQGTWSAQFCFDRARTICQKEKWSPEQKEWCCKHKPDVSKDQCSSNTPAGAPEKGAKDALGWVYKWKWPKAVTNLKHHNATHDCQDDTIPELWSSAKREHCCATERIACPEFEHVYDCRVGASHWAEAWDLAKQAWCCEKQGRGCPSELGGDEPLYDCKVDFANWVRAWSSDKQQWCCKHQMRGCGFDCDAGDAEAWSSGKKEWCCEHEETGCHASTLRHGPDYDCDFSYSTWQTSWSQSQKAWCCFHELKGCEAMGTTSEPFTCSIEERSNCSSAWSEEKKAWCERIKGVPCRGPDDAASRATTTNPPPEPVAPNTTAEDKAEAPAGTGAGWNCETGYFVSWSQAKRDYCCFHSTFECPSWATTPQPTLAPPPLPSLAGGGTVPPLFDCQTGVDASETWIASKKAYCCSRSGIACEASKDGSAPEGGASAARTLVDARFYCEVGKSDWKAGWSPAKKDFCCRSSGFACSQDADARVLLPTFDRPVPTWGSSPTPIQDKFSALTSITSAHHSRSAECATVISAVALMTVGGLAVGVALRRRAAITQDEASSLMESP